MTKNNHKSKNRRKNGRNNNSGGFNLIILLTNIANTVGIPGLIIVYLLFFIERHTTEEQKHELFNKWILFSNLEGTNRTYIIIITFLVVLLIIQQVFYKKQRRLDKLEIKRLSEYKTLYQEVKINKNLHTSK